ncbi:MAG: hypothetical protein JJU23_08540, partial [Cyclobacteriaceae bacterium]|nr:hypothetical protein [Cyclobacteriaceae bacterium]
NKVTSCFFSMRISIDVVMWISIFNFFQMPLTNHDNACTKMSISDIFVQALSLLLNKNHALK